MWRASAERLDDGEAVSRAWQLLYGGIAVAALVLIFGFSGLAEWLGWVLFTLAMLLVVFRDPVGKGAARAFFARFVKRS